MNSRRQKFPPSKCLAIDVDGTLISKSGTLNSQLVDKAREKKDDGWDIILWSARGRDYAQRVADAHGVADAFTFILGKPGFIVDDLGWGWVKYTRVIRDFDAE